ncbi:binding-protein-dependent transport systems inner membrane component [Methylocella silvestris BL2]|uniref:Binding-protein-dependent transport systems inner membrane component n=1 Tax=Methylocella silvestris (strain DSM 15510 / CIP 108128 / LMG 27833 / NCIMB 13906 / BL2) TaxID=395965 RepID=B8ESM8_METSB|nr:ABC transporter permease subunit [Methylocella silvestris]ACK50363.1 binding-protein-dependent transport systems inner membrane component [Methylocella silvestris BL2]
MPQRALSRILAAAATLFIVIALSFFLMRLAPGGPFDSERPLDPKIAENLRRIYRLDLPLWRQFLFYLQSLAQGDFGPSLHWRDFSVNELFAHALPISMRLGAEALIVAMLVGGALGIIGASPSAELRQKLGAFAVDAAALIGVILPAFVIAPLMQLLFGLTWRILPVGGWEDGAWRNQILPVATLALPQIAIVARLMQTSLRDVLAEPHIRTLRAFGLPPRHIYAHALRAAILPTLSYLGLAAANLLTGSVIVETIFGIPGMGRYFVDGALGRDYTLVMGTVVVVAALVIAFNLLVDLAYAWLDPRVAESASG